MVFNRNVNPPANVHLPEFEPKGLEKAFSIFDAEVKKGKNAKILNYIDPDIDGLNAGLIVEQYLDKLGLKNENYLYYLNENRTHGFKLSDEQLARLKGYLIIVTDFTVEKEDFIKIIKAGINLIVIDHHEISVKSYTDVDIDYVYATNNPTNTRGVILNNQYACEPDEFRFLSGAGMVYYFLKYLEEKYNVPVDVDTPAQVGITLLSDIRDIDNDYAHQFLKYTYTLESDFMKYLHWLVSGESRASQRFSPFGVPTITRNFIDFTFSPIINSMLRANKGEDALNLLRGKDETIQRLRSNDVILAFRTKQKGIINKILEKHKELEQVPGSMNCSFSSLRVCCLPSDLELIGYTDYNLTNYIGVACSRITDEEKTGIVLVIDPKTSHVIRGSVRGSLEGVDYLGIFKRNGIPSAGHHNAFGILECDARTINFEKLNEEIEMAQTEFKKNNTGITRSVLPVNNLSIFMKTPISKFICKFNEYSKDNNRIYIKYTGDINDERKVKTDKVNDKYIKYIIDGVTVNCFDPSIDIEESLILIGIENSSYLKCTLRPGFDYEINDKSMEIIMKKVESIRNL